MIQYFNLTDGTIFTVNNYASESSTTISTSTGHYIDGVSFNNMLYNPSGQSFNAGTPGPYQPAVQYTNTFGCGQAVADCLSDAYTHHGWLSVWASVQTAFIPLTAASLAAACAIKNCLVKKYDVYNCY